MFETLTNSFKNAVNKIKFADDEKSLKKVSQELKKSLLKSDVHHKVVKELVTKVEIETKIKGIGKENFLEILEQNLEKILTAPGNQGFVFSSKPPTVVLMTGLQGSGKTTTTGKLALYLKHKGKKVLVVAADLQRLAAVEQLKQIASQIDVDIYFDDSEKNPVKIVEIGVNKARKGQYDAVLVDTAGRLSIDSELMKELRRVKEVSSPDEVFYVADSLTGQDGVKSASNFHSEIGITGVVLTKYDGDSKGGVALGIAHQVNIPLRFIGLGEKMADLEVFIPNRIVNRLMGAGDLESLVEKTSSIMSEKESKEISKKIKKGEFSFNDFIAQLENMKKLGSLKSIVGMIPGMSQYSSQLKNFDLDNSKEIIKIKAMINSMTRKEREEPILMKSASRRRRIANGAGLTPQEVNKILKQFDNASKIAKKLSSKQGMRGLQNMMSQSKNLKFPK